MASTVENRHIFGIPSLWFGVLTGPIMWSLHLVVAWGLVTIFCQADLTPGAVFGINLVYFVIAAATILMLGATILAGVVAYQDWRRLGGGSFMTDQAEKARPFMAFSGVILSALFGLAIVLETYPIVLLQPCTHLGASLALLGRFWA